MTIQNRWAWLAVALSVVGCGQGGGTAANTPDGSIISSTISAAPGEYLPLTVGRTLMYQVTSAAGSVSQHPTTVETSEPSPTAGTPSFRIRAELPEGVTLRWEQTQGGVVVRYEERTLDGSSNVTLTTVYTPSSVVLDESATHLTAGATWVEMYSQLKTPSKKGKSTQEKVQWSVLAVDEAVTVPAGTFSCVKVQRIHTSSKNLTPEVTWYASGIGKVKETGAGPSNDETLELASPP